MRLGTASESLVEGFELTETVLCIEIYRIFSVSCRGGGRARQLVSVSAKVTVAFCAYASETQTTGLSCSRLFYSLYEYTS